MKGQITIEYLVILAISLLIFSTISLNLALKSADTGILLEANSLVKASDTKVKQAVNFLKTQGSGSKVTILLKAPYDCAYVLNNNNITASCNPNSPARDVPQTFGILPSGFEYDNAGQSISANSFGEVIVKRT
ncbi:MAG: hypothetical protein QW097_02590 [archaeon]